MRTRYLLMGDLLMGAAYSDDSLDGRELETVKQLLAEVMRFKKLPANIEQHLEQFDPSEFDLIQTVFELRLRSTSEKRKLLELIAKVHDSDGLWDLDEDAYLRDVAKAMGLPESAYSDLTVGDLEIESISEELFSPPPLPKG